MEDAPLKEELATVPELAEEYGVGRSSIWKTLRDHRLTRYRVPGSHKSTYVRRQDFARAWNSGVAIAPRPATQSKAPGSKLPGAQARHRVEAD